MRATYHKSIAKKRQRTFKECRLLTGLSLIIIGVVLFVVMSLLWSQFLFPLAFNSSLLFQLTIEKNDYLTCSSEYLSFLNNTADASTSVFSFFLFNVSNTADVIQRGDRPVLNQTGPFSYEISHFKYDVSFDENVSSSITYSEYSTLTPINQSNPLKASCSRSFLEESVDCSGRESDCNCHNQDETITVINPLFSKVLWQENGSTLNAYFAKDVFVSIKSILENEFVTAIEMTLVPRALQEIASFRLVMQAANLLQTSYNTLLLLGYTNQTIISNSTELPFTCGLSSLGIPTCPWSSFSSFLINGMNATLSNNTSISPSDFPSASLFFDSSLNISFLSPEVGFSRWVGIMLSLNFINEYKDPAAITDNELTDLYNSFMSDVLLLTFPGSASTLNNLLATEAMVESIAQFLAVSFVNNYTAASFSLLSSEYFNTSYPVSCSPLNELCAWQWGAGYNLSSSLEGHIMDPRSGRLNSLTSIYSDSNAAMYYNAFSFCSLNSSTRPCHTQNATVLELAASQVLPSLLWGDDLYFNQIDPNELISLFLSQPTNVQNYYQSVACSLSRSVFYSYALSSFHEDYVIRFINKNKEGSLNHTFTSLNKQELGWAQFGSGGITFSVLKLRSIGQIRGNGVWATIDSGYVSALIELSSWSILNGYPQAQLWGVLQAKAVLYALADASDAGHALRTMLSSMSTTLTGDGTYFVNGIGSLGERAFIPENNHAIYSCQGDYEITVCSALNMHFTSSFAACQAIEALYIACLEQVFLQNYWATNCVVFQTSISNPSAGIICDVSGVQGYPHPYSKPLGIIVNNMLSSLTVTLEEQRGLVCASPSTCDFTSGGLFITTTVRELLFEGFTDPLVIKYLNLKHAQDNISFACIDSSFASSPSGSCTKSTYSCGKEGVRLLWSNKSLDLVYGITDNNVLFSPYFYRSQDSDEMLTLMTQASIKVMNPVFALHPAWNSNDTNFLKLYQCKGNIIYSDDGVFPKCSSRVDSGLRDFRSIGEIETFHGNGSISYLQNSTTPVAGRIGLYTQNEPFLWSGLKSYPYLYQWSYKGTGYTTLSHPSVFNEEYLLRLEYSQSQLLKNAEQVVFNPAILYPAQTPGIDAEVQNIVLRRFTEDSSSWEELNASISGFPKDSYGMPYKVPIGMAPIQHLTQFPLFVGTPNNYGNEIWGGIEFDGVVDGVQPNVLYYRSFVDMDTVSGRAFRKADRKQVLIRTERGPFLRNLVSSEGRCISPTRTYDRGSGYGCTMYTPLLWTEEARIIGTEDYADFCRHYYLLPYKAYNVMVVGAAVGCFLVILGLAIYLHEDFYRKRFYGRIYVD